MSLAACQFKPCQTLSQDNQIGGRDMGWLITQTTAPEEFEDFCTQNPGYKLENGGQSGWNALGSAAAKGNIALIQYIVAKGGKSLLQLGNEFGMTPLHCAVKWMNSDTQNEFYAAEALIQLGADVNMATCCELGSPIGAWHIPKDATPLWLAAEKTKNIYLVRLLLKHKAIANPPLSPRGLELIQIAKKPDTIEMLFVMGALKDKGSLLHRLPLDLVKVIYEIIRLTPGTYSSQPQPAPNAPVPPPSSQLSPRRDPCTLV